MQDPLIKGHPLHALLTDLPIGMLAGGTACDLLGFATRRHTWRFAARAMPTGACASGAAAALGGPSDYRAAPREHPARRTGAIHGYLNASMLALLLASLLLRRESQSPADGRPRTAAVALSGAALAVLTASGWAATSSTASAGVSSPAQHPQQLEDALRQRGEGAPIQQA